MSMRHRVLLAHTHTHAQQQSEVKVSLHGLPTRHRLCDTAHTNPVLAMLLAIVGDINVIVVLCTAELVTRRLTIVRINNLKLIAAQLIEFFISAGGYPTYAHSSGYASSRSNSSSSILPGMAGTTRSTTSSSRRTRPSLTRSNHTWHGSQASSGGATPSRKFYL